MRCVNCKQSITNAYKSFADEDPTRRRNASQFYKGKRTTKHWCESCWLQWEHDYQMQQETAKEEIRRILASFGIESEG